MRSTEGDESGGHTWEEERERGLGKREGRTVVYISGMAAVSNRAALPGIGFQGDLLTLDVCLPVLTIQQGAVLLHVCLS